MDHLSAIRVFVRIVDVGSFAKAADLMNLSKATATRLVQELEATLDIKLLQRTTRRVTVTPEGAAYYERAQHLIADLDEMNAQASNSRAKPKGRLRVDIGSSLANFVLIPALPDFRKRFPEVQLELGVSDRPMDLIGEGVDCVIRGGTLPDSSLVTRRLAQLEFLTCASPKYIAQYGRPKHPLDLERGHMPIHYASSLTGRPFPLRFLRGDELIELVAPGALSINESTAHLTTLLTGLGISQTFNYMAKPHVDNGSLIPLLTEWTRPRYQLNVLYPQTRYLSAKLRIFIDWIVEIFREFSAHPE